MEERYLVEKSINFPLQIRLNSLGLGFSQDFSEPRLFSEVPSHLITNKLDSDTWKAGIIKRGRTTPEGVCIERNHWAGPQEKPRRELRQW